MTAYEQKLREFVEDFAHSDCRAHPTPTGACRYRGWPSAPDDAEAERCEKARALLDGPEVPA